MARWQHRLEIAEKWRQAENGELNPQSMASVRAIKLRKLKGANGDQTLDEVAEEFEALAEDQHADFDDFDDVMSRLYDWGDATLHPGLKRCWIATS